MKNFKCLVGGFVAVLGLTIAGGAYAANPDGLPDLLLPGSTNFLDGNPVGVDQQAGFTGSFSVLASETTAISAATFTGSLFSQVISGDTHNPLGGLDFVYQITVATSDISGIHRMTVNDFGLFLTDVGFLRNPGEKKITTVDRSPGTGDTVGWSFLPNPSCSPFGCFPTPGTLTAGLTSVSMIVYTNATSFRETSAQFIDGSVTTAGTFAPGMVPEPETYAMMLAGLGLMGFVVRRRRAGKIV